MFKFLKISCKEAATICNKAQYGEATFLEKIKLRWHLLICKICALYSKQNHTLTSIFKYKANSCKMKKFYLEKKDKELLKKEIERLNS